MPFLKYCFRISRSSYVGENWKVVIGLLKQLVAEKNYCVIVVTHDLDIAAQADVVYRMTDGKLDREERAV